MRVSYRTWWTRSRCIVPARSRARFRSRRAAGSAEPRAGQIAQRRARLPLRRRRVLERAQLRARLDSLPEALLEVERVLDRVPEPVVVEVREDVDVARPRVEPARPLVELGVAVVAVRAVRPAVKADEREVGGQLVCLERAHLRPVPDDERDVPLAEERHHVGREPTLVPKLNSVPLPGRKIVERGGEPLVVALEGRRQLPEERPELRRAKQRLDPVVEDREVRRDLAQALDVRHVAADLDGEQEVRRRLGHPARDHLPLGQAGEGHVDLDPVEGLRVEREPVARRTARGVEDAVAPVGVVPARAADPYALNAFASFWHPSDVPAATTRERPSRSSGARPKGGSSKRSIGMPRSRTSSWAAAMSTERAGLTETTPSTRPAARWHSESAREPITRIRCASSATCGACCAISEVTVASNDRISSSGFGPAPSSGSPFRNAPRPRSAVHSSWAPRS